MANENKDVIRVFDTAANLPTTLRNGQIGFDTTNDRIGVKRLADGQMIWFENADDTDRTDIVIDDNSATAFRVREASNNYFAVDTTDSSEIVYIGNLNTNPTIILNTAGKVLLNDTANAKMSVGITIKDTNSDEMFALKSAAAHGVTDDTETNTIYYIKEGSADHGGVLIEALTDAASTTPAMHFVGTIAGNDPTYQSFTLEARKNYGTGTTTINDTTRILVLKNGASEKVTFAGDGDIWTDGSVDTDILTSDNATELLITNTGDGDVRLYPASGDIIAQGTLLFSGTYSGLLYGSAQSGTTSIAWSQVMAVNTWYEISDADIVNGDLNGITHDGSGQLTVGTAGVYDAIGIISLYTDTANVDIQITFSVNGTPRTTRGIQRQELINTFTDEVMIGTADTLDLSASDTVEVAIRTVTAGNPTITVTNLTLKLVCIGGT